MDKKIKELLERDGNQLITIDVSGKIFKLRLKTLLSKRDSIFYKFIVDDLMAGIIHKTSWTFDRDNQHFSLILDFLRTGFISVESMPKKMMEELKAELEFFGIWGALTSVNELISKVTIVDFKASGRYSNAGKHSLEGIGEKDGKGGICVQSPYEITFELNMVHELAGCDIKGWVDGNSSGWGCNYGENAEILVGETKDGSFNNVGRIPNGFGSEIKTVKFKSSVKAKFVRFKHNSYLGIGYINFFK